MSPETLNSASSNLWADQRIIYAVAVAAVATLVATIWLFRRQQKAGRGAAFVCLILAVGLHAALLFLVPMLSPPGGGAAVAKVESESNVGQETISFSTFDPEMNFEQASASGDQPTLSPLPISNISDLLTEDTEQPPESSEIEFDKSESDALTESEQSGFDTEPELVQESEIPNALTANADMASQWVGDDAPTLSTAVLDEALGEFFEDAMAASSADVSAKPVAETVSAVNSRPSVSAQAASATHAMVPGDKPNDFAARVGDAKYEALHRTGGDNDTEAAVAAALKFLTQAQRDNGCWDPADCGAGRELAPLGMTRARAGTKSHTALTGLSLLALLGAGETHQRGVYADNVYRGLAYLIQKQHPDGSLAGDATIYAASYAHGMAALSISEAAAITRDPSAIASATRALAHSVRMQHPTTGGWRYTRGDPGDLSQLGWQAMVVEAASRAGIRQDPKTVEGIQRFLKSVRTGNTGGLASYRPREAPSRTMTAEAMATRLLIGETVPAAEITEAQRYLLQKPPGTGQDDYYYWYYATLALHQLQDQAWRHWNDALKQRLLATQREDGSWSANTVWGGYGGTVYTTAMATLCLETYYRHTTTETGVPQVAARP